MKKIHKIIIFMILILMFMYPIVQAHGGNITGWKDKNSDKIMEQNGVFYGYHKQEGKRHYHEVQWNEEKQKWEIVKSAVYYDENLKKINLEHSEKSEKMQVQFSEKVDGDTAKFDLNGQKITVRFLGIDTPETVHPTKEEEPFGKEASDFTEKSLKNASKIELQYDTHASKMDKYERHLAWIWVDDVLLQEELLKNGLAKTYMLQDNYDYAGVLQEAEQVAKGEKKGIWENEKSVLEEKQENNVPVEKEYGLEMLGLILIFLVGIIVKVLKK